MELRNPPDLGELGGVRSQRGRRRHQHLEVLLQVGRDQLQVRLAQRLELKLRIEFQFRTQLRLSRARLLKFEIKHRLCFLEINMDLRSILSFVMAKFGNIA